MRIHDHYAEPGRCGCKTLEVVEDLVPIAKNLDARMEREESRLEGVETAMRELTTEFKNGFLK